MLNLEFRIRNENKTIKTNIQKCFCSKLKILNSKLLLTSAVCLFISLLTTGCVTLGEQWFFYPEQYKDLPLLENEVIKSKEINLKTKDGTNLNGIFIKNTVSNDYLIYFYGNMNNIKKAKKRLYYLAAYHKLNVICFDYRGYGKSEGGMSFDTLPSDALEVYDYVIKKHKKDISKIFLFSQSLGTVPCTTIGSERNVDGIIMEAAFTNAEEGIEHMPDALIWPLCHIIKLQADENLLNIKGQPIERIKNFTAPLLSIHGTVDNCFPYWMGRKLHDAAGSKDKTFITLEGISHDNVDIIEGPAADAITAFVRRIRTVNDER